MKEEEDTQDTEDKEQAILKNCNFPKIQDPINQPSFLTNLTVRCNQVIVSADASVTQHEALNKPSTEKNRKCVTKKKRG